MYEVVSVVVALDNCPNSLVDSIKGHWQQVCGLDRAYQGLCCIKVTLKGPRTVHMNGGISRIQQWRPIAKAMAAKLTGNLGSGGDKQLAAQLGRVQSRWTPGQMATFDTHPCA